ncbi:acetyoacetyl CoA reductase [Legionella gratiana]|uniref:Acetyoacetyl CoA reductase n=1 Tax=Legionella gratiana TaxID=45066 RepID=A0A378JML3_9GAMM|nr:SDR family oxidoreductase [Legionella gratiana]KTD13709.1 acetyoacetyl CoA reductase [Legionella gratiana]STX45980.1 acetyoacetyl CoA reductase [Legionella gratiana]
MPGELQGKVALITGGTKSIGLGIAKKFSQNGATVIITGRTSQAEGEQIAGKIGATAIYLCLNVASETDWECAATFIKEKFGQLDILVNNAGIDSPPNTKSPQDPEHCSIEDWEEVHHVNLRGVFLAIKFMLPFLKESSAASIINMGSRSGLIGVPDYAAYSSSKAAVLNYTKTVAIYCKEQGYPISCNAIVPAAIDTEIWDKDFGHGLMREEQVAQYSKKIPWGRMGTVEEVAKLALFLAANPDSFMTGAPFIIDGGITAGSGSYSHKKMDTVLPTVDEKDVPRFNEKNIISAEVLPKHSIFRFPERPANTATIENPLQEMGQKL